MNLNAKVFLVEELEGEEPSDGNQVRRDADGAGTFPRSQEECWG